MKNTRRGPMYKKTSAINSCFLFVPLQLSVWTPNQPLKLNIKSVIVALYRNRILTNFPVIKLGAVMRGEVRSYFVQHSVPVQTITEVRPSHANDSFDNDGIKDIHPNVYIAWKLVIRSKAVGVNTANQKKDWFSKNYTSKFKMNVLKKPLSF